MKKYVLGAAAALAIVAPGVASADSGEVTVSIGSFEDDSDDYTTYGLEGAYINNLSGDWVVQFDGTSTETDWGSGYGYNSSGVGVSGGIRNETYAAYGFLASSDVYYYYNATTVGAGGQYYLPRATLGASVAYSEISYNAEPGMVSASVEGMYFFTDNIGVGGSVGWGDLDDWDHDFTSYGIDGVWRPTGTNFTIGAAYEQLDTSYEDIDTWKLSLTYNFGTGSELERSQSGASFGGVSAAIDALGTYY